MGRHTFDLAALKAKSLPHCTYDSLAAAWGLKLTPPADATPEEVEQALAEARAAIDKQVAPFIPPQKECIGCGAMLSAGNIAEALMSTFTYGLAHGEGHCGRCGYPARANHYAPKGGPGLNFNRVLQYHPDGLEELPAEPRCPACRVTRADHENAKGDKPECEVCRP